jgi:hypothetical protein
MASLPVWTAAADDSQAQAPAVLMVSAWHAGGHQAARRLHDAGIRFDQLPYPGVDGSALTWEEVRAYNVLIVTYPGHSQADGSLTAQNQQSLAVIGRFMEAGGGVLYLPIWMQMETSLPTQRAMVEPLGLKPLFDEVVFDPGQSVNATAWELDFAPTRRVRLSPDARAPGGTLWYPVAARQGQQQHTTPLMVSEDWTVLVEGEDSAFTRRVRLGSPISDATAGSIGSRPVLAAAREVGPGRMVAVGISPDYLLSTAAENALEGIVTHRGLQGEASCGAALLEASLRWLAQPSLGRGQLGGAAGNPALLVDPQLTQFAEPYRWPSVINTPQPGRQCPGVIGARSSYGGGQATVAQWVDAARAAGLTFLVFLDEFTKLTPQTLEALSRECRELSTDTFTAVPGFVIDDEVGNHYFYFSSNPSHPDDKLIDSQRRWRSYDPELNPGNPHAPGQLSMTTLLYTYQTSSHRLTAGNYLRRQSKVPSANFFCNWCAAAVTVSDQGRLLEDATDDYLTLAAAGNGPMPLALEFMTNPSQLTDDAWRTVLTLPEKAGPTGQAIRGHWDSWPFFPENPHRIFITQGRPAPSIDLWGHAGPRDYDGNLRGDYVWQNRRWVVYGQVSSIAGLREVAVYDGPRLFRRFEPDGDRRQFRFQLDLTHDRQHHLVVIATDDQGRRAISGEQFDRDHRLEEFMCTDRNNQLSYGYGTNRAGQGLTVGGNQTLATPIKRADVMFLHPAGAFRNDPRLGAPAFDGAPSGDPIFATPWSVHTSDGAVLSPPPIVETQRILHSGDVNMGSGAWTHRATDDVRTANVWHSLWRTEPSTDFIVEQERQVFRVDPDAPAAAFIWHSRLRLLRDLPNSGIDVANLSSVRDRVWAMSSAGFGDYVGRWASPDRSLPANLVAPMNPGDFVALLDSPLGSAAVFPLTANLQATVTPASRSPIALRTRSQASPQRAGETLDVSFLIVGLPRAEGQVDPADAHVQWLKRVSADFGLGRQASAYVVQPRLGRVVRAGFPLHIDGASRQGFAGVIQGSLTLPLPVRVDGLCQNWTVVLLDRARALSRPLGVQEGTAWATVIPVAGSGLDLFIGHPVVCNRPEAVLAVTQKGDAAWSVELHNPTTAGLATRVQLHEEFHAAFPGLALDELVTLAPGQSRHFTIVMPR